MNKSSLFSVGDPNGFITVPKTKTGVPRKVPIHSSLKSILNNPEFIEDWGIWRLEQAFRKAVKRSGIEHLRFHDLRHTFCSRYLESGGTIADLREISGHQSLQSLQVYAHFQPSKLKERIDAINY